MNNDSLAIKSSKKPTPQPSTMNLNHYLLSTKTQSKGDNFPNTCQKALFTLQELFYIRRLRFTRIYLTYLHTYMYLCAIIFDS